MDRYAPPKSIFSHRNVQKVTQESSQDKLAASSSQLRDLLEALHDSVPPLSPRDYHTLLRGRFPERLNALSKQASDAVLELFGFSLVLGPSRLTGGGVGVFVERGCVRKGQLVALYPGEAGEVCVGGGGCVCVVCAYYVGYFAYA